MGETVALGIVVRDVDTARTPMNAAAVSLRLTRPDDGAVTVVPVANPPGITGFYSADVLPDVAGLWRYQWTASSPALVLEGSFNVDPPWPYGLVSMTEAKRALKIPPGTDVHDDDIRQVVLAATAAAEKVCKRVLARRTVTETRAFPAPRWQVALTHRPIISVTSADPLKRSPRVAAVGSSTSYTAPLLDLDENGIVTVVAGGPLVGMLRFTYDAGSVIVSPADREAVIYIIQHLWQNRGGASARPRGAGSSGSLDAGNLPYSIPNRARDLLGHPRPLVG